MAENGVGVNTLAWRAALQATLNDLPKGFDDAKQVARAIRQAMHEELATALKPRLDALVKTMPKESYAEKQALAHRLNYELHELGLALRCPKTKKPATLLVDIRDSQTQTSRFRLEVDSEDKSRRSKTYTSQELPELDLTPELPRPEGGSRWKNSQSMQK